MQRFVIVVHLIDNKLTEVTEKELISGCVKGDSNCRKELYNTLAAKMLAVCYRYVGDKTTAEDLLHDGFITLFSHISSYKGSGSFEGWVRRIFVTTSLGYLRQQKRFSDENSSDFGWYHDEDSPTALDMISDKELMNNLMKLPVGYRTVLNLYAIEGYSHKEIGEKLGIEESSSRSQFLRAKKMLKKYLEQ